MLIYVVNINLLCVGIYIISLVEFCYNRIYYYGSILYIFL